MKKISVKTLEKKLGYKIPRNIFVLGVDTASTSGIAKVTIDDKYAYINTEIMKIPTIPRDTEDKAEKYEECLDMLLIMIRDFRKTLEVKDKTTLLVLENSFMSLNAYTFGFLKVCGGILYSELHDNFENIKIIFPSSARKLAGFKSLLPKGTKSKDKKKEIMTWVGNIIEEEITDDNAADALMLCFAGLKI